jgi:hypothetical protein
MQKFQTRKSFSLLVKIPLKGFEKSIIFFLEIIKNVPVRIICQRYISTLGR